MEFRTITEDNFQECIALSVRDDQKSFVATNLMSLAEAYVATANHSCIPMPYAIYDGEQMVGFIMMSYQLRPAVMTEEELFDEPIYSVWRLMIDQNRQGKGCGRQAMAHALDLLRTRPCGEADLVVLSYELDNEVARKLYASVGFVESGKVLDGEMVAVLRM